MKDASRRGGAINGANGSPAGRPATIAAYYHSSPSAGSPVNPVPGGSVVDLDAVDDDEVEAVINVGSHSRQPLVPSANERASPPVLPYYQSPPTHLTLPRSCQLIDQMALQRREHLLPSPSGSAVNGGGNEEAVKWVGSTAAPGGGILRNAHHHHHANANGGYSPGNRAVVRYSTLGRMSSPSSCATDPNDDLADPRSLTLSLRASNADHVLYG